jgi:uncharacterized protein
MRIEGSYAFPAPPERILQTLADADVLCAALPGCERLIQLGPPARDGSTCYEARLRLHERVYVADLTVIPNPEARRVLLRLNGRSPDGPFHGEGELALAVPLSDDGHTQGTYTLELEAPGLSETPAVCASSPAPSAISSPKICALANKSRMATTPPTSCCAWGGWTD